MFGAFRCFGFPGVPFAGFALLKAVYTAALGFAVARWVILRQLLRYRTEILRGVQ
jgi:hypothetical protein